MGRTRAICIRVCSSAPRQRWAGSQDEMCDSRATTLTTNNLTWSLQIQRDEFESDPASQGRPTSMLHRGSKNSITGARKKIRECSRSLGEKIGFCSVRQVSLLIAIFNPNCRELGMAFPHSPSRKEDVWRHAWGYFTEAQMGKYVLSIHIENYRNCTISRPLIKEGASLLTMQG